MAQKHISQKGLARLLRLATEIERILREEAGLEVDVVVNESDSIQINYLGSKLNEVRQKHLIVAFHLLQAVSEEFPQTVGHAVGALNLDASG